MDLTPIGSTPETTFGPDNTSYEAMGGADHVLALVTAFYDRMDLEPALETIRNLHPADLSSSREKLYESRLKRPSPLRDDKIVVAWNGLMISAFAQAGFSLEEPAYTEAARSLRNGNGKE